MDSELVSPDEQPRFFGNYDRRRIMLVAVVIALFPILLVAAILGGNPIVIIVIAAITAALIALALRYRRVGYELDEHVLRSCHLSAGTPREAIDLRRVHRTGPTRKVYLDLYTDDDVDRRDQNLPPLSITMSRMSKTAQNELRAVMEDQYGIDCSTFRITFAERASRGTRN